MRFAAIPIVTIFILSSASAGKIVYPQAVLSPEWRTVVSVTNPGTAAVPVEVRVYSNRWTMHPTIGEKLLAPFALTVNGVEVCPRDYSLEITTCGMLHRTLQPMETVRFDLGADTLRVGFVVVESSADVVSSLRFDAVFEGDVYESTGVVPNLALPSRRFALDVASTGQSETGIAFVPQEVEQLGPLGETELTLLLYDDSGELVGQSELTFSRHLSAYLVQLFDEIPQPFRGCLVVEQTGSPVQALGILVQFRSDGSFEYTSIPLNVIE